MPSAVPSRSAAHPRLGVALLVLALGSAARIAPAGAGDPPPPPAAVRGTVVHARDGRPVAYASVADTVSRIGAVTDAEGRFLLAGLTAGPVSLRVSAPGSAPLMETFELAPGDTAQRAYRLAFAENWRFLELRDSLSARGQWPPTLEPALLRSMRDALDVRVYRLDPSRPRRDAPPAPADRVGPWPIAGEVRAPERAVVHALLETLRDPDLYLPNLEGVTKLCGFAPEVAVRFNNTGVTSEVLLCYACGEFEVWSAGRLRQAGDFERREAELAGFARRMFPDDRAFRKRGGRDRRASR
jgi:hypothetical protein